AVLERVYALYQEYKARVMRAPAHTRTRFARPRLPLRVPHPGHGEDAGRVCAGGDRGGEAPRSRFRPGDARNAPQPRGEIPVAHLQCARGFARAARRVVPGIVRSSDGDNGVVNDTMQSAAMSAYSLIP